MGTPGRNSSNRDLSREQASILNALVASRGRLVVAVLEGGEGQPVVAHLADPVSGKLREQVRGTAVSALLVRDLLRYTATPNPGSGWASALEPTKAGCRAIGAAPPED